VTDQDLIMKFLKQIKSGGVSEQERLEYWEDYKKYYIEGECSVIIADPSHFYGILDYTKVESDEEWKRYRLKEKLKLPQKEIGRLNFDGYFYNLVFLFDALPMLGSEEFDIKIIRSGDINALCFKIDDKYCLCFGELVHSIYELKSDGVWFIDEIYDDDTDDWTEVTREFVKWKNGVAIREPGERIRGTRDFLYDKSYFFEEIENFGGFMML